MKPVAIAILAVSAAVAQTTPQTTPTTASISGVVRDKVTKQPLANYNVSTSATNPQRDVQVVTDQSGRYSLSGLPPGRYRIDAQGVNHFLAEVTRRITLAGQDLTDINLDVTLFGTIHGRVLDENKEPIPGASVYLVSREYYLGSAGYFLVEATAADDQGLYTLAPVPAGHPYFLLARPRAGQIPAHSEVPLNPKFRRKVAMRTWYPNSPDREGAMAVMLRPGETREGMDFEMKRSPSYCVEGVVSGPNGPAEAKFEIAALQPHSGANSTGGMFVGEPRGTTGSDGKLRICDLTPGRYRVEVQEGKATGDAPANFGVTEVLVKDEDQRDLKFLAGPGLTLDGDAVWDTAAAEPTGVKVSIDVHPTLRTGFPGSADWDLVKADIPGPFSFRGLFFDEYAVQPRVTGKGRYIKEVTYGGRSVQYEPLRWGGAMQGTGLRIVVGRDGGTITAQVADKDGGPVPDANVVLFPLEATSEGAIQAQMVAGQTDQLGRYTSKTIAPGKYYVLASEDAFDATVESVGKLARSRTTLKTVELGTGGAAQVSLELVKLM